LSCVLDTLSLGEAGPLYRDSLSDGIRRWREALTDLAKEAGLSPTKASVWAEEVVIAIEGSLVLARASNDPDIFLRAVKRLGKSLAAMLEETGEK